MNEAAQFDVAVVGGGPAGLSAGIWLARYLHTVALIDSGDPRNWETRGINGYLGLPDIKPAELRGRGRDQCRRYGVELIDDAVDTVRADGDEFLLGLRTHGALRAKRVLLAIGVRDIWPDIEGLDRCFGATAHVCPDCDGYETRDRKTLVIGRGRKAVGMALALATWTSDLLICTNGVPGTFDAELCAKLDGLGVPVIEERIVRLQTKSGDLKWAELEGGSKIECDRIFFAIGQYPSDDLGAQLQCKRDDFGHIIVDRTYRTSVRNVYAAGDIVPGSQLAIASAADGAIAALAIHHSLLPPERQLD